MKSVAANEILIPLVSAIEDIDDDWVKYEELDISVPEVELPFALEDVLLFIRDCNIPSPALVDVAEMYVLAM